MSSPPPSVADHELTSATAPPRRWLGLSILLLAAAMELLDTTIVNVAIPSIEEDLGATASQVEWVVAGYILTFAVLLVTGGRLGDAFGRRRVFMIGIAGFTLMSLACGAAATPDQLVTARLAQGASAALMIPQVLASIRATFPAEEHAKAYGMYGAFVGLATVSGPLIGGALVQADLWGLSWRPIFLVNVPVGILAAIGAWRFLPESTAPRREGFDVMGVGILTTALLLVTYPLVQGAGEPWTTGRMLTLAAAAPVLALFYLHERRRDRRGASPLVPFTLFRSRSFTGGFVVGLVFFGGVAGFFLALTITLQRDVGLSAIDTGLAFLPWSIGIFVASGIAVNTIERLGKLLIVVGVALMTAGMSVLYVVVDGPARELSASDLVVGLALAGLGMGAVAPTLIDYVLRGVPLRDAGAASGVLNTALQVGGAIGVAVLGHLFFREQPIRVQATTTAELTGMTTVLLALVAGYAVSLLVALALLPRHRAPTHR